MRTFIAAAFVALLAAPAVAQPPRLALRLDDLALPRDRVTLENRIRTRIEAVCGKPDDFSVVGTFKLSRANHAACVDGMTINSADPQVQAALVAVKQRLKK